MKDKRRFLSNLNAAINAPGCYDLIVQSGRTAPTNEYFQIHTFDRLIRDQISV